MLDTNTIKNIYANKVKVGHVVYVCGERRGVVINIETRKLVNGSYYDLTFDNGETSTHRQDRIVNVEVDRKFTQHDVRQARQLLELTQGDVNAAKRTALGGHADEARKRLAAAVEAVAPKDAPEPDTSNSPEQRLGEFVQEEVTVAQDALERFQKRLADEPFDALISADTTIRMGARMQAFNWVSGWLVDGSSVKVIDERIDRQLTDDLRNNVASERNGVTSALYFNARNQAWSEILHWLDTDKKQHWEDYA